MLGVFWVPVPYGTPRLFNKLYSICITDCDLYSQFTHYTVRDGVGFLVEFCFSIQQMAPISPDIAAGPTKWF